MSYTESKPRGTTIANLTMSAGAKKSVLLKDKKQKKETDKKVQAPDDLVKQKGKAPDKNGKIVAGGPGSGRKPNFQQGALKKSVLNTMHKSIVDKGYAFSHTHPPDSVPNAKSYDHLYTKKVDGKTSHYSIIEKSNGAHINKVH